MSDSMKAGKAGSGSSATLDRTIFETSRTGEYFDARQLQTMTGQPVEHFVAVIAKELFDNGIDDAEQAGSAPRLDISVRRCGNMVRLSVQDNGTGIKPETIRRVLNFQTTTSDKAAYRSPTRGAQGNALKTVIGIPYALGSRAPVIIEAGGKRHVIRARVDAAGEVRIEHDCREVTTRPGTRVIVEVPAAACRRFHPTRWAAAFALFNPHATVRICKTGWRSEHGNSGAPGNAKNGNLYRSTVPFPGDSWRKFLPTDPTSAWWYDHNALARLIFCHIAAARKGERDLTLREFVRQFRGLARTAKAKAVCDQLPHLARLGDLDRHEEDIPALLEAMQGEAMPPSAGVLGRVGEEHFRHRFERWFGIKRWWYKKAAGEVDGIPFLFEVALAATERPGAFFHGVNFSPTFADPLSRTQLEGPKFKAHGIGGFLLTGHVHPEPGAMNSSRRPSKPTAVAVHLVCPALEFLDKGKTTLRVPEPMGETIAGALWSVTKNLYAEEERRKKDAARQERTDRNRERRQYQNDTLVAAVFRVILEAVQYATGGIYPVSAHTLFYSIRRMIQQYTTEELDSKYCEQNLIPRYQQEHGPILLPDGQPALYYEARGTLYEPHTGKEVQLGTREVESYRFPAWRYDKILFIEKQGLWPIFKAARLGERYDMAIVAGEGYASEACRILFANAEQGQNCQLFVGHDADPHGYNIGRVLGAKTKRMPGHHAEVISLGLKLEEALAMGLEVEEFTRRKALPQGLELTDLERRYFEGRLVSPPDAEKKEWICRRVELNALTAPGLIGLVERGLEANGVRGKVLPPESELPHLAEDLYRGLTDDLVNGALSNLLDVGGIQRQVAQVLARHVPLEQARAWAERAFARDRSLSWQEAITSEMRAILAKHGNDLNSAVLAAVLRNLGRE